MKLSQEQLILCGSSLVLMVLLIYVKDIQLLSRIVKTVPKISEAFEKFCDHKRHLYSRIEGWRKFQNLARHHVISFVSFYQTLM